MAASIAIIAITTSNSINVKPVLFDRTPTTSQSSLVTISLPLELLSAALRLEYTLLADICQ